MRKQIVKVVAFLAIGIAAFLGIQEIMTPEWNQENMVYTLEGFEQLEENILDVLFLGTSHVEAGVLPMELYESSQICAYSLATSAQTVEGSYFMLKKAFETQCPKVVVLDASGLVHQEEDNYNVSWRYILDALPFSQAKLEMASAYGEKWYSDGILSALVPIVKYHTRWNELSSADFTKRETEAGYYSAGGFINSITSGAHWSLDHIMQTADRLADETPGVLSHASGGTAVQEEVEGVLYTPQVTENTADYLEKINELCKEHGSELLLIKVPVLHYPQFYTGSWTKQRSEAVSEAAEKNGVVFLDLLYEYDTGVNFATDTVDGGLHLNFRGAQKVSDFLASYLLENYEIEQGVEKQYLAFLAQYKKMASVAMLQSETNFYTYMDRLIANKNDWTIMIAAREEYTIGMRDADYALFEELGLQLIRDGKYMDSYLAVINQGLLEYEAVSDRRIHYKTETCGKAVSMMSSGWYTAPAASVVVNGKEYSSGTRGLSVVVFDNASGLVIDSVMFDTFTEGKAASRNWTNIYNCLRAYESAVCFGEE